MELSVIIKEYLEGVGGLQCPVCDKWDDKDKYVHGICSECNKEVIELMKEAETYDKYDDPFYLPE